MRWDELERGDVFYGERDESVYLAFSPGQVHADTGSWFVQSINLTNGKRVRVFVGGDDPEMHSRWTVLRRGEP